MKRFFALTSLLMFVTVMYAQVPDMRTNLRYDDNLCRYEVYVEPSANYADFNMGPSQIVIAVPHDIIANYPTTRSSAFNITTEEPSGAIWSIIDYADKDQIGSYDEDYDYYSVAHLGGNLGALTANQEILLFHFTLPNNCIDGLRLWEGEGVANNGVGAIPNVYDDPKHPTQPYGGGGDFETNFTEATTNTETWVGNYLNVPTVLPLPQVNITYICDNPPPYATITANVTGVAGCSINYDWSTGTGAWAFPPAGTASGLGEAPFGEYIVIVTDYNGCEASANLILDPSCSPPLPVELLKFSVMKDGNVAVLDWITASEINNNYFDVEHSNNGEDFNAIGRVYSQDGNSTEMQYYDFVHNNPSNGINYYRLRQVDFDGQYEYSDIRSVVFGQTSGLKIYPNPTNDILNISIPTDIEPNSTLEIVNNAGQIVRSISNPEQNGALMQLNVGDIAKGFYFIQIRTSDKLYREQFVIAK